jgi:hypothetical protein
MAELRSLVIVLGDQLDVDAAVDAAWMADVAEESTHGFRRATWYTAAARGTTKRRTVVADRRTATP